MRPRFWKASAAGYARPSAALRTVLRPPLQLSKIGPSSRAELDIAGGWINGENAPGSIA